ncbi:sensor histidine kinase [Actinophytocola xanthii]|uniref:histidine kinase n=1 Tax=Actinophytocola xanthii TaxID=1912961 RepID=A0A1Q8CGF2_9PSEU|nr:histidine kinase [Actinophytocola xanthii]OLF13447.1 two-component sensor histidine kinase [Actinophytocola xanthii]
MHTWSRPLRVDVGLVVVVVCVQLWPFLIRTSESGEPWDPWGYVVVVASAVPVLWRRRAPVVALTTSLVATSLYDTVGPTPEQPVWYGGLVVAYTVAVQSAPRVRITMLVLTICGSVLLSSSTTALRFAVMFVAVYAIGRAAAESRARTARLEEERGLAAERAAERERARIARDMHDILSHAVSLMVVQAEAGPVVLARAPADAEAAFDAIAAAGRDAMVQLRRILTVLRTEDGPHAPQPTLDDLPSLVAGVSGLPVAYEVAGEPVPLSPDVELAVYRITQEALTNIVRHANASRAEVHLAWSGMALTLTVTDDGTPKPVGAGGNGLIGIRERAAACGGGAELGPRQDARGFRVAVRFPLRAVVAP